MPLSGTIAKVDGSMVRPLDPNLLLVIQASLANVRGSVGSTTATNAFTIAADPQPVKPSWISIMDPGAVLAQAIAIDFTSITNVKIFNAPGGATDPAQLAFYDNLIATQIEQHFIQSAGLKYYLTCISNTFVQDEAHSDVLKPTAFCFSIVPGDTDKKIPGTMCMWIAVKGGAGNYTVATQNTAVTFHPDSGDNISPIPTGSTANVIFRYTIWPINSGYHSNAR